MNVLLSIQDIYLFCETVKNNRIEEFVTMFDQFLETIL